MRLEIHKSQNFKTMKLKMNLEILKYWWNTLVPSAQVKNHWYVTIAENRCRRRRRERRTCCGNLPPREISKTYDFGTFDYNILYPITVRDF